MQRLEFAKVTSKIKKTETQVEEYENKREGHGRNIALTRNVFYLRNSKHVHYVQSEHSNERYYYVDLILQYLNTVVVLIIAQEDKNVSINLQ